MQALNRLLLFAALSVLFTREASAYTDPGTGALLWQILIGAAVGASFYFRRFLNWFGRKKADD